MNIKKISDFEFICLMASLMAMASLSIDAILPALGNIGNAIGVTNSNNTQLLITSIFLGTAFGQLISGTISDSIGRKPVVYLGYLVFVIASLLCVFAPNLEIMVLGRLLQGIGLSAPRSVSMAIVRDKYSGNYMARIMSFITIVFMIAPIIAPAIGQFIFVHFGWQAIFTSQLLYGLAVTIWLWQRQAETLNEKDKKPMKLSLFTDGLKEFFRHKDAIIYTIALALTSAPFIAYLSASQKIFQEQYRLVDEFPYIFSGLGIAISLAAYLNGKLVLKFGMLKLVLISLAVRISVSIIYVVLFFHQANPSVTVLIAFLALMLFTAGFIIGNINALAMQPLGHIAGIGAAILSFVSTFIAVTIATIIGRYITTTALPLLMGFSICGVLTLLIILIGNSFSKSTKQSVKTI